jgi:hypothetical protein
MSPKPMVIARSDVPRGWLVVTVTTGLILALSPAIASRYALARTSSEQIDVIRTSMSDGLCALIKSDTDGRIVVADTENTWSTNWSSKSIFYGRFRPGDE